MTVEWYLHPATAETVTELRAQIGAFLRRHAADPDEVWAGELTAAELIGNAVDHNGGQVWVTLDWSDLRPVLAVHDLGPAFELDPKLPEASSPRGRGLWLVSQLVTDLSVAAKRSGGKRVSATLPVRRRTEDSFDPRPQPVNPLPALEEAGPDGFGREAFLRALVVQLALAMEDEHGPPAAQATIARVGATVGSQMEAEFRRARDIVEALTPAEIADCYLRLKGAIGGEFHTIELRADRIVLGSRRCPFGEDVRRSPALCRMTSSVFGGIAARNAGEARVVLDERIALGDPHCRVTVHLGPAAGTGGAGHRYHAAAG